MNFVILANTDFREPVLTLDDADLGRLSTVNELGE